MVSSVVKKQLTLQQRGVCVLWALVLSWAASVLLFFHITEPRNAILTVFSKLFFCVCIYRFLRLDYVVNCYACSQMAPYMCVPTCASLRGHAHKPEVNFNLFGLKEWCLPNGVTK